jgi:hypothetical protein
MVQTNLKCDEVLGSTTEPVLANSIGVKLNIQNLFIFMRIVTEISGAG